jgi:hypothetical protein
MEMEMEMGVRRINVDSYLEDDAETTTPATEADVFEEDSEDEVPERSSVIQVGWGAAKKVASKAAKSYATDFRFEEDVQLIKFLSSEPMCFSQHWVQRQGKKSFICPGTPACPLCRAGNNAESKFAFSVVNLSADESEDLTVQMMTVGIRLVTQLGKLNEDPKTGPLDRMYWAVSKSGQGAKTTYSIMPVKDRDLADDWDIDPTDVIAALKSLKALDADSLRPNTMDELKAIAREMPEE